MSTKLALAVAGVTAACALLAVWVGLSLQAEARRAEFRETHRQAFELLALAMAPSLAAGDHHAVQAAIDNLVNFPERYPVVRALEVLDREGRVVGDLDPRQFGERREASGDLARMEATVRGLRRGRTRVVVPIVLTHAIGVLRATVDESPLLDQLARQRRGGIMTALAWSALLAITLSLLLRRLVGRRVRHLSEVVSWLRQDPTRPDVRADERGGDEIATLGRSFNEMADELAARTVGLEELVAVRTRALEQANARLSALATTDPLTGLRNRRHFDEHIVQMLEVARRGGRPLALAILDVDHFKSVNDTWGHAVGDVVLVDVAVALVGQARSADVVARVGGEEFAVVLPDTDLEAARVALDRLLRAIASAPHPNAPELGRRRITASAGLAVFPDDADDRDALVMAADAALYAAKHAGRDRVVASVDVPMLARKVG